MVKFDLFYFWHTMFQILQQILKPGRELQLASVRVGVDNDVAVFSLSPLLFGISVVEHWPDSDSPSSICFEICYEILARV